MNLLRSSFAIAMVLALALVEILTWIVVGARKLKELVMTNILVEMAFWVSVGVGVGFVVMKVVG